MILERVRASNWFSYKTLDVRLDRPGVTVVIGRNGAGKSAIVELPSWVIAGKFLREGMPPDEAVRRGSSGGMFGRTYIRDGEHQYIVTRYRDHKKFGNKLTLKVDGEDRTGGTNDITQKRIDDLLGDASDYDTLLNTTMFCARDEVKNFFNSADSARKKTLDRVFRLEWVADAYERAKVRLSLKRTEATTAEASLASVREAIDVAKQLVEGLGTPASLKSVARAKRAFRDAARAERRNERRLKSDRERLETIQTNADGYIERYNAERTRYEDAKADFDERLQEVRTDLSRAKYAHELAVKVLATAKAKKKCPTCGQKMDPAKRAKNLKSKDADVKRTGFELDKASLAVRLVKRTASELPKRPERPKRATEGPYADLKARVESGLDKLSSLSSKTARLKAEWRARRDKRRSDRKRLDKATAKVKSLKLERNVRKAAVENAAEAAAIASAAADVLSPTGLRSYMLDNLLPAVNKYATKYVSELMGTGAYVRLSATTKLKSKKDEVRDRLSIDCQIPGLGGTYGAFSRSQRKRASIALMLGMRQVSVDRRPRIFDQLFVDEAFDGVDAENVEAMADMLSRFAKRVPVLLVTHDPNLKSIADHLINVEHYGKYSRVT